MKRAAVGPPFALVAGACALSAASGPRRYDQADTHVSNAAGAGRLDARLIAPSSRKPGQQASSKIAGHLAEVGRLRAAPDGYTLHSTGRRCG